MNIRFVIVIFAAFFFDWLFDGIDFKSFLLGSVSIYVALFYDTLIPALKRLKL